MVFSEFGRRLEESDSAGTDHGSGGPIMLSGSAVRGGLAGEHPGVNVNQDADELPADTPKPPTSLRVETGREWPRAPLLAAILLELEHSYDSWQPLHTNR